MFSGAPNTKIDCIDTRFFDDNGIFSLEKTRIPSHRRQSNHPFHNAISLTFGTTC